MIFGRKKDAPVEVDGVPDERDAALDDELEDEDLEDADDAEVAQAAVGRIDEWDAVDAGSWRDDGPFDIEEVDLDADEVERIDLGALVLTPIEGMQVQLQVDQESQQVQSALVMKGRSGIEVSVFAAPAKSVMIGEVRREMARATVDDLGGTVEFVEGPFGTEVRRVIPMTAPDGQENVHVSRTWLVQGPRWLLRGVLMGEAGMTEGLEGPVADLYELFVNLVVRRDDSPRVPGDLIPMTLPAQLAAR